MALRVLGISTSPRREGNSDLLLRQTLAGAEQAGCAVEYLRLCDYRIEGYLEVDYVGSLCINQVDEKGAILQRPDALEQAHDLGRMLVSTGPLPPKPVKIDMF